MKQKFLVGIDIGSSFTKSSIYDIEGNSLGAAKRDTRPHQPAPGVAEYDPDMILTAVVESLRELMEITAVPLGSIAAIFLDGMQSGVLGIGANGNPTTPYTTTLDLRFAPYLNRVLDRHHDQIRSITGSGQPTIAPKIMWIRDAFPDAYRQTAKFATISGYLLAKLAGLQTDEIFMDLTYLWVTGLSDTQRYVWSEELAGELAPGSENLFFVPHLGGRASSNNMSYRGAWFGFSWTHTRAHFYRALLESIAYDQYLTYQSFCDIYPEANVAEITAYGGGSKSGLWNQIKADVMGVPYVCLGRDDVAAIGNAILAGYALGIYDDMTATSEQFMKGSTRYEPNPEAHQLYRQYASFYAELLDRKEPAYASLTSLPHKS
jgi:sugar (pentulose or hexulose) kinase